MESHGAQVESSQSQRAKEYQNEPGRFLLGKLGALTGKCPAGIHCRCPSPLMQLGIRENTGAGRANDTDKGLRSPNFVTAILILKLPPCAVDRDACFSSSVHILRFPA